jgi:hypothetical protein
VAAAQFIDLAQQVPELTTGELIYKNDELPDHQWYVQLMKCLTPEDFPPGTFIDPP